MHIHSMHIYIYTYKEREERPELLPGSYCEPLSPLQYRGHSEARVGSGMSQKLP